MLNINGLAGFELDFKATSELSQKNSDFASVPRDIIEMADNGKFFWKTGKQDPCS